MTSLLRNLHAGQEVTVRTGHGTADWFKIRKGVHQVCILPTYLFNLYAGDLGVKEKSEKAGLKSTFKKLRSRHQVPSLHGK